MKVVLCVAILLLAGCSGTDEPDSAPAPQVSPAVPMEYNFTLYFANNFELTEEQPSDGAVDITWSYPEYLTGVLAPQWTGATNQSIRIISAELFLSFQSTAPVVTGAGYRPELTAWWGTQVSVQDHVFLDGPDAMLAGDRIDVGRALRVPVGGLVLGPEDLHSIHIGTYYEGHDGNPMQLVTGPSRIEFVVEPYGWPNHTSENLISTTGELVGNRCVVDTNIEDRAQAFYPVELTSENAISIRIDATAGASNDIDFMVFGPGGEVVGGGHGSGVTEGTDVWWANTEAAGNGTYMIQIFGCLPPNATYSLEVTKHTRTQ